MENSSQNNIKTLGFTTLWFGAAVSIAEILSGSLIAPLGFKKGALAIILGHLLGTTVLVLGGLIGTMERLPSIKSTQITFGKYGSILFSLLNILQLTGWTVIMLITGARSLNILSNKLWHYNNNSIWVIVVGALVCVWLVYGKSGWQKLNNVAVILLFLLTLILSYFLIKNNGHLLPMTTAKMSFGGAVELSAVMPLSWLPLIADFTRYAKSNKAGAIGSFIGYFFGSSWMYLIGLGICIKAGTSDPASIMLTLGLGPIAVFIIILAVVTTTFMDAYSAGVSSTNITNRLSEKTIAIIITILGTGFALKLNLEQYENFLYAIGSVFAPMFAILLTDYFILKNKKINKAVKLNITSIIVWIIGIFLYYRFINIDFVMGATLPVMVITALLYLLLKGVKKLWN